MNTPSLPLVSVIISSYNHAAYIEKSIKSVINQTYSNIELLVIDDGSTDNSVEMITKLQKEYGFDFLVQKNKGLSQTLNEAIARAKGSLIIAFGSDDIMLPERVEKQALYMQDKPEVGICGANIDIIDGEGNLLPDKDQKNRHLPFRRLDFYDYFLDRKPGPQVATMTFRKEALEKVGGFNPNIRLEDVYIILAITKAGYYVDILGEVLGLYRKHGSNTYKNLPFMFENLCKTYEPYKDDLHYNEVFMRMCNSMFLKSASKDKPLAKNILKQIPWKYRNKKTFRGISKLWFS